MKLAIIGGGPAGLFAAIHASSYAEVSVFEKNSVFGKKFLLSGLGQCNISNACSLSEFLTHYGQHGRFLKPALYAYTPENLLGFFQKHGAVFITEASQKIFPESRKASELLAILDKELKQRSVQAVMSTPVESASFSSQKGFLLSANGKEWSFDKVILATGGKSYPQTGSTGDGYSLAEGLGHRIIQPRPGLTDVKIKNFPLAECAGQSFTQAYMEIYSENRKIHDASGALLITHNGFSGPLILNNARHLEQGQKIVLSFIRKDVDIASQIIREPQKKKLLRVFLKQYSLSVKFIDLMFQQLGFYRDLSLAAINKEQRKDLVSYLQRQAFLVFSAGSFKQAMVTVGGVALDEINSRTMESKLQPGLFFAGELIDVDGDTGGFNLQAAFSTAYLAAVSLAL